MDFESPDVEREFPGLYMSESASGKRSQESDFSDEAHERSTKKDLLIGKRKDKKESKKDQGYAALEGESSPEEELDVKSPYKSKKSKSFKFPTIKEKREKSREKEVKEREKDKDKDKDKDIDRDKDKKKESKSKLKLKDKKKVKTIDDVTESVDEMPVFGVPLSVAIDRSRCHDGVEIPVVVRDCIDHIQDCGLGVEGIYKISGVKSKVQQLRRSYNKRESVKMADYDVQTVTSLLKTFLRELPESLLTTDLASKFEDSATLKETSAREQELCSLLALLPSCNLICLSWLIRHLENVAANECHNKMGATALGVTLGPVLQTSPRVVTAFVTHCNTLFPNVRLVRYIPPLSAGCSSLPKTREAIIAELAKQDSLLNQIHSEMNHGWTVRSDQLWEVQRFVTQLKRHLKGIEKAMEVTNQTSDDTHAKPDSSSSVVSGRSAAKQTPISPPLDDKIDFQLQAADESHLKSSACSDLEDTSVKENISEVNSKPGRDEADATASNIGEGNSESVPSNAPRTSPALAQEATHTPVHASSPVSMPAPLPASDPIDHESNTDSEEKISESQLQLEHLELLKLQAYLASRLSHEREQVENLRTELNSLGNPLPECQSFCGSPRNSDVKTPVENLEPCIDEANERREREELYKQNLLLMQDRLNLVRQIMLEHEACINLRIQLGLHQDGDLQ